MAESTRLASGTRSLQDVQRLFTSRFNGRSIRIYEAGGGSASCVPKAILDNARITVVDIDEGQLQRNNYAHTKILGDIQTKTFPPNSFDLVVCYNVIEHLNAPDRAIDRFFQALGPGGLLFIGAPNPSSFSGWMTKMTPHWFHVQYYRYILKYRFAGQAGHMPFPTVFHSIVKPSKLIEHCRGLGFNPLYFREYEGWVYENLAQRRPSLARAMNIVVTLANAFVLWRRDLRDGDYHVVFEKPEPNGRSDGTMRKGGYEH